MKFTKFVVDSASLIVSGRASVVNLGQLSTSDPLVTLLLDPKIVMMIGGFVTWALNTWKQIEEIRSLRSKSAKKNGLDEITALLEKKVKERIDIEIEKHATELVSSQKAKGDHELTRRIERTLRMLLQRVERGYHVYIMLPDKPEDEKIERSKEEDSLFSKLFDLQHSLQFPPANEDPMLALTSDLQEDENKQEK